TPSRRVHTTPTGDAGRHRLTHRRQRIAANPRPRLAHGRRPSPWFPGWFSRRDGLPRGAPIPYICALTERRADAAFVKGERNEEAAGALVGGVGLGRRLGRAGRHHTAFRRLGELHGAERRQRR